MNFSMLNNIKLTGKSYINYLVHKPKYMHSEVGNFALRIALI
jgi:hypothetical protein